MLINLRPLAQYRDYRLLYFGQLISFLGSMISYVAVPYQVYQLSQSSAVVGLLGVVQLVPVLLFGLLGGSVADSMDRRKLLLISEGLMSLCSLALALNATFAHPNLILIFAATAVMQAANGFHRPAMDAMTQQLVEPKDFGAVAALSSLRSSAGAVLGPAMGGMLIAFAGAKSAYLVDFATFLVCMIMICLMRQMPMPAKKSSISLNSIKDGLLYALKRPELMGTYIVDIIAMTFAFPTALFPALAEGWGGAKAVGILFSAMSAGSLVMTLLSGWTHKVSRHGAAVIWSAGIWGVAIIAFGYSHNLYAAVFFLGVAGAADMVSGLFRGIIWNETIPNHMRGRLSGIEMISYMSGPLLGNARAGWVAAATTTGFSIVSGGVLCVIGIFLSAFFLPQFWKYVPEKKLG